MLTCRCNFLYPVYTIQPVVKPVVKPVVTVKPVWQPCWMNSHCSFNRVERTATVRSTGCQTGLYNRFDNRLYRVNKHPTSCQTGCQTDLTTGLTTVLNEQPLFVQQSWTNSHCSFNRLSNWVVQPVWQPAVSCKQTSNRLSNRLSNRFDNQFDNRVEWAATVRSAGLN